MKTLSPELQAHLDTGATTLAWCWRLTRRDGVIMGFTDHDRDIAFDGTTFEAASGFSASEIKDSVGLNVDNLEVSSALSSTGLNDRDLTGGLYDEARIEIYRVNWQDPGQGVLVRAGSLGEVTRAGSSFVAEVRGLAHYLQHPQGRIFQYTCDADLGDARCGIDLENPAFKGIGVVSSVKDARTFIASGLVSFETDWFTRGLLTYTSGNNTGRSVEVKRHEAHNGLVTIELWYEPVNATSSGDTFVVSAGCDKHRSTCTARFANIENFRGFPDMPGNDFVTSYVRRG